jgi:hypothetical protein
MSRVAAAIIGNAVVWGIVLIAISIVLKGTEESERVRLIVSSGAGASLLVLAGTLVRRSKQ